MSVCSDVPDSESRGKLLGEVAGFLVTLGYAMAAHGTKHKNAHTVAIGVAIQIAGDLSRGVHKLIENGNYYAAVALSRQLLEATQLIKYFQAVPERGVFWLNATDSDMRSARDFKPAALRQATQASDSMYSTHCALGGHPRSMARLVLPGSPWRGRDDVVTLPRADGTTVQADLRSLILTDALQHVYETVLATIKGLTWMRCRY